MAITIAKAFTQWQELAAELPQDDEVMLSESWNNYTDSLCKDGELTALQYHYCPGYGDSADIPGADFEAECAFLLEAMGVKFSAKQIAKRTDGLMQASATHWEVTFARAGQTLHANYSMGAAHTGMPKETDVFHCLLNDADGVDELFETWADNLGYDSDSRQAEKIYNACKETAYGLARLFKPSELSDLREIFSEI